MNQDPAHSSRLHHTGVTDVMAAKRRVVATCRAFDLWNRFSLLWKQCSHCSVGWNVRRMCRYLLSVDVEDDLAG
jgi:hypothetical protein